MSSVRITETERDLPAQAPAAPVVTMQRYEMKYILTAGQTAFLKERMRFRMRADRYGLTTVASLYYDTPDRRLIRASLERTGYKEKIRLRSYGPAVRTGPAFLELKRKASGIVYKRRIRTTLPDADRFFAGGREIGDGGQIAREILRFRDQYGRLEPACLIACERTAYDETAGDLRLTIDEGLRFRTEDLRLDAPYGGEALLEPGQTVLELKVQQAVPLWLAEVLSEGGIRRCSFSKYGEAYRRQFLKEKER